MTNNTMELFENIDYITQMDIKANEIKKSVGMSLLTFHSTMKDNPEFSNFYPHTKYTTVPFEGFNFKNKRFTSVEIFFQYYKFKLMNTSVGNAYAQVILNSSDSLTAKKLGGKTAYVVFAYNRLNRIGSVRMTKKEIKLKYEEYLQSVWYPQSVKVMYTGLWEKFKSTELRQRLLDTVGMELGEKRSWPKPTFWTLGGQNMLGKLLMLIRDRIIREQSDDNTQPSTDYDIELE